MTSITILTIGSTLTVESPYHPKFPARAKLLGGKWNAGAKAWDFDARDEQAVRDLCREIYGTDGSPAEAGDIVTLRITVKDGDYLAKRHGPLALAGRIIAQAWGRDSGARLGEGVVFTKGRAESGGSVKNWATETSKGAIFEIRDVPRRAAEKVVAGDDWLDGIERAEIIEPASDDDSHRQALLDERARLLTRLAEIDAQLGDNAQPTDIHDRASIMRAAHAMTRQTRQPGDDYRATFAACLRAVYDSIRQPLQLAA